MLAKFPNVDSQIQKGHKRKKTHDNIKTKNKTGQYASATITGKLL